MLCTESCHFKQHPYPKPHTEFITSNLAINLRFFSLNNPFWSLVKSPSVQILRSCFHTVSTEEELWSFYLQVKGHIALFLILSDSRGCLRWCTAVLPFCLQTSSSCLKLPEDVCPQRFWPPEQLWTSGRPRLWEKTLSVHKHICCLNHLYKYVCVFIHVLTVCCSTDCEQKLCLDFFI